MSTSSKTGATPGVNGPLERRIDVGGVVVEGARFSNRPRGQLVDFQEGVAQPDLGVQERAVRLGKPRDLLRAKGVLEEVQQAARLGQLQVGRDCRVSFRKGWSHVKLFSVRGELQAREACTAPTGESRRLTVASGYLTMTVQRCKGPRSTRPCAAFDMAGKGFTHGASGLKSASAGGKIIPANGIASARWIAGIMFFPANKKLRRRFWLGRGPGFDQQPLGGCVGDAAASAGGGDAKEWRDVSLHGLPVRVPQRRTMLVALLLPYHVRAAGLGEEARSHAAGLRS